jgi:hypothetical protein
VPVARSANVRLSAADSLGSSRWSWKTIPMRRRSSGSCPSRRRDRSCPAIDTTPSVGTVRRSTSASRVLLPAPEWPVMYTNSPLPIVKSTLRSAWVCVRA